MKVALPACNAKIECMDVLPKSLGVSRALASFQRKTVTQSDRSRLKVSERSGPSTIQETRATLKKNKDLENTHYRALLTAASFDPGTDVGTPKRV